MKVLLITICYNEEKMLPHFINYYSQYCDKMIFFDGGSTDNSHNIIKQHPKCELNLDYVSNVADDLQFLEIKNHAWKKYREEYDWCLVVDIDEFLYYDTLEGDAYELGLKYLFNKLSKEQADVAVPLGYDMYSEKSLAEIQDIFTEVQQGVPNLMLNKLCLFNLKTVIDMNYDPGCHVSHPIGVSTLNAFRNGLLRLLHYRYLGLDDILQKKHMADARRSEHNKAMSWGYHNGLPDEEWIASFNENLKNSIKVI